MKFPKLFGGRKGGSTAPVETKESAVGGLLMLNGGEAAWSSRDYKAFADEGYRRNVIAYQSINKIAESVASVEWEVWQGDTQLSTSPLLDLLAEPNPMQSGTEFILNKIAYLMISGNSYDEAVMLGGVPKELYTHRPDRMSVLKSKTGFPRGYEYNVNNRKHVWEIGEVRHMKLFNPLDDWYGMSPIEAGSYAIDQHNESMTWMQALLQNSARPSGALSTKDDASLSDDQFARLKNQIETQYAGSGNAGRPMLLEGGLTWQQMGMSPVDVAILDTKYSAARDIALAFGVPPQLLGIKGDNTYSNYAEARLAFWEDTVIPLVIRVSEEFTNWLGPQFGDVKVKANMDSIPAIAEKRAKAWEMANTSTDLTINERREIKGFGPVPGGDVVLVNAGQIPLGETSLDFGMSDDDQKALAIAAGYETKT